MPLESPCDGNWANPTTWCGDAIGPPHPWWHAYVTSPWFYRTVLIAVTLYVLWLVAGWLDAQKDRAKAKAEGR